MYRCASALQKTNRVIHGEDKSRISTFKTFMLFLKCVIKFHLTNGREKTLS